jgi:NAD(P)-dependent dehydrogenase (short-subunit alcohol dehydrogenase family)
MAKSGHYVEEEIMGALEGKIAVITGGNSGIGLATAKRFVEEGAYVFITARRQAELNKGVCVIEKNVTAIPGDLSDLEDIDRIAATVTNSGWSRIDGREASNSNQPDRWKLETEGVRARILRRAKGKPA